jgi:hypothetical protein
MIIELQEKKMHIEIFGETPLDSDTIKKHLKGGLEPKPPSPLIKAIDEASNASSENEKS